jgi:hypothetical protein
LNVLPLEAGQAMDPEAAGEVVVVEPGFKVVVEVVKVVKTGEVVDVVYEVCLAPQTPELT